MQDNHILAGITKRSDSFAITPIFNHVMFLISVRPKNGRFDHRETTPNETVLDNTGVPPAL
jgi:hypothetical protein